jgi:hypothetical protein
MRVEKYEKTRVLCPEISTKNAVQEFHPSLQLSSFLFFRVMMGAFPMYIPDNPVKKVEKQEKQTDI